MKKITKRQREVLLLVGQGYTNSQIAEKLFITEHTVKAHLGVLYETFNCYCKVQLVLNSIKCGNADLDEF